MARILVVDDDSEQAEMRCVLLREGGHDATAAYSPEAALKSYRRRRPDVVLMDLKLPRAEDGMGLLRDLGPEARVVILSGSRVIPSVDGAARVLRKPCSSATLLKAIRELA